ncbi:MAG: hypothetical protein DHS20C12_02900 [Pseudohongiella sp.]|nr:MAG: hypothetical protein DHS20C12_02900 [Pseudohongiella sp.]
MQNQTPKDPLRIKAQHVGFFETPIAYCQLEDGETLIRELEKSIRENQKADSGLERSNFGGWHSDTDMLEWGGKAAARLAESAINIAKRMTHFQEASQDNYDWQLRMWANVTPAGGLNHMHAHPGNLWAAVLYLDMGDEPDSSEDVGGAFYVEDPRFPMSAMHNTAVRMIGADGKAQQYEVEFNLKRGNLVLFPAWLRHGVRPYTGKRERISIAMNIDARRRA